MCQVPTPFFLDCDDLVGLETTHEGLKFHHLVAEADRSKLREFLKPLGSGKSK